MGIRCSPSEFSARTKETKRRRARADLRFVLLLQRSISHEAHIQKETLTASKESRNSVKVVVRTCYGAYFVADVF